MSGPASKMILSASMRPSLASCARRSPSSNSALLGWWYAGIRSASVFFASSTITAWSSMMRLLALSSSSHSRVLYFALTKYAPISFFQSRSFSASSSKLLIKDASQALIEPCSMPRRAIDVSIFGSIAAANAASKFAKASMKLAVDLRSLPGDSRKGSYSMTSEKTPASERSGGTRYSIVLKANGESPTPKTIVNNLRKSSIGQYQLGVVSALPTPFEARL